MKAVDHKVTATVSTTGEVIEYSFKDSTELGEAYKDVEARLEAYKSLKRIMLETSMHLITRQDKKK